jgi:predicted TIM-barrel fold metal-dependent hydrolase
MSQPLTDGITGGDVPASTADELIARLDEANVQKAVVQSLGYWNLPDDSNMAPENDFVAAEVGNYTDRLIGFCGINPLYESALGEIDRCLDLPGMVGIKLHLANSEVDMTNEDHVAALSAVFDKIQERDAPVLMHVGTPLGLPLDADGLANLAIIIATHPEVRVVHAHCAGETDEHRIELWIKGMEDGLGSPENFYLEMSSCLKFFRDAPLAQRELMVWRLKKWGLERVFLGSDYLMVSPVETPKEALETLSKYPFTQEEIDIILDNDASAWLNGP